MRRSRPGWPSTVTVPAVTIWVPTMLRISVVLPQPDGPEQAGDGAAGDLHREVVQRRALAADHPQVLDDDGRLDASLAVIHHSMKSSCDE